MRIGTLLRALALLALFWIATLGPRAWPVIVAARDPAALPRAALRVESYGCERHEVDDLLWRCQAKGTLQGGGEFHWRQAVLALDVRGEEPGTRYEPGASVDVAILRLPFDGGLRLLEADGVAARAAAEVRWLSWQPLLSVGVVLGVWLASYMPAFLRRRRDAGAIELTMWPGLPGVALALVGLVAALAAGLLRAVPVSTGPGWLLLLLVPVAPALVRVFVRVDRPAGQFQDGVELGPWRRLDRPVSFSGIAEVRLQEAPHVQGVPAWEQWRLEMAALDHTLGLGTGHPRRMRRLGADLAAYLGVPLLQPGQPSTIPSLGARRAATADGLDAGEEADVEESDEAWLASLTQPQAPEPAPPARDWSGRRVLTPRERLERLPRGLLGVLAILVLMLGIAIVNTGGIDPFAAHLLRAEVESWPAGRAIRRAAVAVVSVRARHEETLGRLVRLAHTVPPQHALWRPVMEAAQRVLGEDYPLEDPATALARLDAAASRALGRPLGPLGVLGWHELDEYWVLSLDDLASEDEALAIERFNTLRPPDSLPTGEWFLEQLGRALADRRPIAFAVVLESGEGEWRPLAVSRSSPGGAHRLAVTTVGEALGLLLAMYPEHRPASPPDDVARWWAPIATARGLPQVGGGLDPAAR